VARFRLILAAAIAFLAAGQASAGEVACWFDAGVVVVPAEVAGIVGDYILDTGTAQTTLQKDRVQGLGIEADDLTGDVRLADLRLAGRPLKVADLDVRSWNLPTPIAGVIGADVLKDYVVDVEFAPCRVRLSPSGRAPRFRGRRLALGWDLGRPTAWAEAFDGPTGIAGPFVIATGANVPLRLADDLAQVPGAATPQELYPDGVWLARLPAMRLAGATGLDVAAGLMKPDGAVAGVIGGEALANFRLRFDFPAGRLVVAPLR
jgi:hypothetical protein